MCYIEKLGYQADEGDIMSAMAAYPPSLFSMIYCVYKQCVGSPHAWQPINSL